MWQTTRTIMVVPIMLSLAGFYLSGIKNFYRLRYWGFYVHSGIRGIIWVYLKLGSCGLFDNTIIYLTEAIVVLIISLKRMSYLLLLKVIHILTHTHVYITRADPFAPHQYMPLIGHIYFSSLYVYVHLNSYFHFYFYFEFWILEY